MTAAEARNLMRDAADSIDLIPKDLWDDIAWHAAHGFTQLSNHKVLSLPQAARLTELGFVAENTSGVTPGHNYYYAIRW